MTKAMAITKSYESPYQLLLDVNPLESPLGAARHCTVSGEIRSVDSISCSKLVQIRRTHPTMQIGGVPLVLLRLKQTGPWDFSLLEVG